MENNDLVAFKECLNINLKQLYTSSSLENIKIFNFFAGFILTFKILSIYLHRFVNRSKSPHLFL